MCQNACGQSSMAGVKMEVKKEVACSSPGTRRLSSASTTTESSSSPQKRKYTTAGEKDADLGRVVHTARCRPSDDFSPSEPPEPSTPPETAPALLCKVIETNSPSSPSSYPKSQVSFQPLGQQGDSPTAAPSAGLAEPVQASLDQELEEAEACVDEEPIKRKKTQRGKRGRRTEDPVLPSSLSPEELKAQLAAVWKIKDFSGQFQRHVEQARKVMDGKVAFKEFLLHKSRAEHSTDLLWYPEVLPLQNDDIRTLWKREFTTFLWGLQCWTETYAPDLVEDLKVPDLMIWSNSSPLEAEAEPKARKGLQRPDAIFTKRTSKLKAIKSTALFEAFFAEGADFASRHGIELPEPEVQIWSNKQFDERVFFVWDAMVGWARGHNAAHLLSNLKTVGLMVTYPTASFVQKKAKVEEFGQEF